MPDGTRRTRAVAGDADPGNPACDVKGAGVGAPSDSGLVIAGAEQSQNPHAPGRREALRSIVGDLGTDLVLEIGCGHGHFLTAYGGAHPERPCVGVDFNLDRVERAERKRTRGSLGNVRFIRADIEDFLAALPQSAGFSAIFILFPDPWPKRRHHKNRLMREAFLQRLADWCVPAARLHFRTDHKGYFAAGRRAVASAAAWEIVDDPWPFEYETVFQARAPHHQSLIARRL